ncbi:MAG: hypothetical protein JWM11_2871 [Planctomycetaceae bacterium]|nr:hypothetical protein [Planctomycetaceae bacterium]
MPVPQPKQSRRQELADPLLWLFAALVSGLTFVRWWGPTEGTLQGDTLGVVLGWITVLALLGWIGLRGTVWTLPRDGLQYAVCLLGGGHVLSGCLILATSGDQRAALNLIWEWLGLMIAFPLLRLVLETSTARREWTVVAIGAVVTLSAYGLIQRTYVFPKTIAEYLKVRDELDAVERTAQANAATSQNYQNQLRIQELQAKLIRQGVQPHMLAGSSRVMFEGRLLHSTEVLGRFALANTFAGLLLVWWLILALQTLTQIRALFDPTTGASTGLQAPATVKAAVGSRGLFRISASVFLILCTLLVGYCLLLTKSRTAYLATCLSLGIWSLLAGLKSRAAGRTILRWSMISLSIVVVLSVLITVAGLTGGLDRFVLSEAPKSLQYRLEYWWSSLQVIKEAPLTGVGPGQFRQHYLAHKLPRSSEEIADPHNLILDVWANGGILALAGLVWMIVEIFRSAYRNIGFGSKASIGDNGNSTSAVSADAGPDAATLRPSSPTAETSVPVNSEANSPKPSTSILIPPTVRQSRELNNPPRKINSPTIPQSGDDRRSGNSNSELSLFLTSGWTSPIRIGALCSLLVLWISGSTEETLLCFLLVGWAVTIALLDLALPRSCPQLECWLAAGCGLVVHLSGAGGIAMPAITQLLVVIAILNQPLRAVRDSEVISLQRNPHQGRNAFEDSGLEFAESPHSRRRVRIGSIASGAIAVLSLALFGICFITTAQPVWLGFAALEQADFANSISKRDQYLHRATSVDTLAHEPWEKIAGTAFQKWRSSRQPDDRDFEAAITAQRAALSRNPLGYQGYRSLGEYYLERARRNGSSEDKRAAVNAMRTALQRYPNHSELAAVAAEAFSFAGERELAEQTAQRALDQDEINHTAQHTDKWLAKETRQRLEVLAGQSSEADKPNHTSHGTPGRSR